jgi:hypothetical protein
MYPGSGGRNRRPTTSTFAPPAGNHDVCALVDLELFGQFSHFDRVILIRAGYRFGGTELRAVIADGDAESQPLRQMDNGLTNMSRADDYDHCRGKDRFHKYLHSSAAHAHIAA